jgi:EAL domain-containing protein (putative c-di-GMP-specific phosphodiesterase class I)
MENKYVKHNYLKLSNMDYIKLDGHFYKNITQFLILRIK